MEEREYIKLLLSKWTTLLTNAFHIFHDLYGAHTPVKFQKTLIKLKGKYLRARIQKEPRIVITNKELIVLSQVINTVMKHKVEQEGIITSESDMEIFKLADKFMKLYLPIIDGNSLYKMERSPHLVE